MPPHHGDLVLGFVLQGSTQLHCRGAHRLGPADCFVIPPGEEWRLAGMNEDFRLLHVTTENMDRAWPTHRTR